MFGKKKSKPASQLTFEEMFRPFASLSSSQIPAFEYYLLGAIADQVGKIGQRALISERDASDVFSAVPQAVAIATGPRSGQMVPEWRTAPSPSFARCRREVHRAAPMIAEAPHAFLGALMPALQGELSHYAGNRKGQIRSCWVWTMYCFIAVSQGRGADTTWAFPALGEAVQLWELAARTAR